MRVTVILVAYHADNWLPACISSMKDASESKLHVVLVDNSGNSILHQLNYTGLDIEHLQTPYPMGFAEANNFALVKSRKLGEIILFLNQDTVSTNGWIDECVSCLRIDSRIGAISPIIRTYDGKSWDPSFLDCLTPDQKEFLDPDSRSPGFHQTDYMPAPSLLVRRSIIERTGPFDPIYGSYYEDYDLCLRIKDAGFLIGYCGAAYLNHFSGSATDTKEKELKRMRLIIRNRIIFNSRKNSHSRLSVLFRSLMVDFPVRIIRGIRNTASSQPVSVTLLAFWDVIKMMGRLVSKSRDTRLWNEYLSALGWKTHLNG